MALLRGPKLLNAQILPEKSFFGSEGEHWLLGCLFLIGSAFCWSLWLILQVFGILDPIVLFTCLTFQSITLLKFSNRLLFHPAIPTSFLYLSGCVSLEHCNQKQLHYFQSQTWKYARANPGIYVGEGWNIKISVQQNSYITKTNHYIYILNKISFDVEHETIGKKVILHFLTKCCLHMIHY